MWCWERRISSCLCSLCSREEQAEGGSGGDGSNASDKPEGKNFWGKKIKKNQSICLPKFFSFFLFFFIFFTSDVHRRRNPKRGSVSPELWWVHPVGTNMELWKTYQLIWTLICYHISFSRIHISGFPHTSDSAADQWLLMSVSQFCAKFYNFHPFTNLQIKQWHIC